jgi:hypothetical protein
LQCGFGNSGNWPWEGGPLRLTADKLVVADSQPEL